eukprot:gnl/Carplike_NY0171/3678_a4963_374.p1 GENE.gnl/Carplike_NY0171/3678_a4963_374~~gnl/Carplike_NY0171/3678_a4963_374.p1  ORF type:complete len:288 (-),score=55.51 gnl/Carplike_NY0171/3678_a4963_374:23-787(-)
MIRQLREKTTLASSQFSKYTENILKAVGVVTAMYCSIFGAVRKTDLSKMDDDALSISSIYKALSPEIAIDGGLPPSILSSSASSSFFASSTLNISTHDLCGHSVMSLWSDISSLLCKSMRNNLSRVLSLGIPDISNSVASDMGSLLQKMLKEWRMDLHQWISLDVLVKNPMWREISALQQCIWFLTLSFSDAFDHWKHGKNEQMTKRATTPLALPYKWTESLCLSLFDESQQRDTAISKIRKCGEKQQKTISLK